MKAFGRLYQRLDSTTSINLKVEALVQYFEETPPQDAAWGLNLLLGKRQRRIVTSRMLRDAFLRSFPDFPVWLLEESYGHVGDTGETVSLLLASRGICPNESQHSVSLSSWMEDRISKLSGKEDQQRAEKIFEWWSSLTVDECYLLNKLLTGGLRVGVSQKLVVRALSKWSEIPEAELTHRFMGEFEPSRRISNDFYLKEEVRKFPASLILSSSLPLLRKMIGNLWISTIPTKGLEGIQRW